ncbi:transposase [Paraburkholderia phytofirmans]|uniref:transposase n=1 Tax=Paraburkholderia phytofirmans TaxID=261302 RepID=UPI0009ED6D21|nr:transposase [Paraburkholderia phytofirmans]
MPDISSTGSFASQPYDGEVPYVAAERPEISMLDFHLSDPEWERIKHLFPRSEPLRGRPPRDNRAILNAILWVQKTGEKWHRLPSCFPPQQTVYGKYLTWRQTGVLQQVFELLQVKPAE